ncbi:MAG: hypothetical protein H7833_01760 [Magnetococcus sp. DMHC-1]
MKEINYLEDAIMNGFMLRKHLVEYKPFPGYDQEYISKIIPAFNERLKCIGSVLFNNLDLSSQEMLLYGVFGHKGEVPMLCFTEFPSGRSLLEHKKEFGNYGIVVTHEWVMQQNGDRVVYIGGEVGRRLAIHIGKNMASSLFMGEHGKPIFENQALADTLDLFCFFQPIEFQTDSEEFEWRICGKHGLMGGKNDHGKRLKCGIDQINFIYVKEQCEVIKMEKLLDHIFPGQNMLPKVMVFPDNAP